MNIIDAIILGLVQGLTEFLPVSSTGHLVLMHDFLNVNTSYDLAVDATLHFATALAVLIYFRNDLLNLLKTFLSIGQGKEVARQDSMLLYALILGTIPAVVLGLLFEDAIENVFREPSLVAWVLIAGSGLFMFAEYYTKRIKEYANVTPRNGLYVGFFQALALLPGMSRSGATISGGMLLGFTREQAARFSFLLSLPVILGAGGLKLIELGGTSMNSSEVVAIFSAAVVAFLSGLLCIHYLLKFLRNHTLYVFVVYRIALAVVILSLF